MQDEKYEHLDPEEMKKVEKQLQEKTEWFDKQLNACSRLQPYDNPPVTASVIRSTKDVSIKSCVNIGEMRNVISRCRKITHLDFKYERLASWLMLGLSFFGTI